MTAIQTMLFDLDGTLMDTAADFNAVLHTMCEQDGLTPPDEMQVHQTVSSGARALVHLAYGIEESAPDFARLYQLLLALYGERIQDTRASLYPGMATLLDTLESRDIAWGVVTNKPLAYTEVLMHRLDLTDRCRILICPEHVTNTKPDPEPVLLACSSLQRPVQTAVYVGDHPRDIEAGRAAGMLTIAAAYGYLPAAPPLDEWGADIIAHSVDDISQWLDRTNVMPLPGTA